MEFRLDVLEPFAELPGLIAGEPQAGGEIPAQDDAAHALHHVKRASEDGGVLGVGQGPGAVGKLRSQGFQDPVFAPHVMGRAGLGAERRPPEHQLPVGGRDEIGEVGVAARELPDGERPAQAGDGVCQERCEPFSRELLPFSDGSGLVKEVHGGFLLLELALGRFPDAR